MDSMSAPTKAILMFKAPLLGQVKTRLARTVGDDAALDIYRWMGLRQLKAISEEWEVEARFAPDTEERAMRDWLGGRPSFIPQGVGDLGARMDRAVKDRYRTSGSGKTILLGADCLQIDDAYLREAESILDDAEIAIGPAADGGYTLLGLNGVESALFNEIPWGGREVLSETLVRIQDADRSYRLLPELSDVDDWATLVSQKALVDESVWERKGLSGL